MIGFSPHSLEEALEIRTAHPEAVPVAGGTDLMVEMNSARIKPAALLDRGRLHRDLGENIGDRPFGPVQHECRLLFGRRCGIGQQPLEDGGSRG